MEQGVKEGFYLVDSSGWHPVPLATDVEEAEDVHESSLRHDVGEEWDMSYPVSAPVVLDFRHIN